VMRPGVISTNSRCANTWRWQPDNIPSPWITVNTHPVSLCVYVCCMWASEIMGPVYASVCVYSVGYMFCAYESPLSPDTPSITCLRFVFTHFSYVWFCCVFCDIPLSLVSLDMWCSPDHCFEAGRTTLFIWDCPSTLHSVMSSPHTHSSSQLFPTHTHCFTSRHNWVRALTSPA
jgi:hypothetical protein